MDEWETAGILLAEEWIVAFLWLLGAGILVCWPLFGVYATIGVWPLLGCWLVPLVLEGM